MISCRNNSCHILILRVSMGFGPLISISSGVVHIAVQYVGYLVVMMWSNGCTKY